MTAYDTYTTALDMAYAAGCDAFHSRGTGLRGTLQWALMDFDHRNSGMFRVCPADLLHCFAEGWADEEANA